MHRDPENFTELNRVHSMQIEIADDRVLRVEHREDDDYTVLEINTKHGTGRLIGFLGGE